MKDGVLGDFITLKRGYDLPNGSRRDGDVPVISSSGPTGTHNEAKVEGPGVVTGRYGTLGEIFYCASAYWPLNTALYVTDFKGNHPKFVYYFMHTLGLGQKNAAGAVPGVNRNVLHKLPVCVPELRVQHRIAEILSAYDDLIEINNRRMALLEESIHLLYREWFVYLRFPGHERVEVVDGVPVGWRRRPMREFIGTQYGFTASARDDSVGPQFVRGMDINKRPWIDWDTVPYCEVPGDQVAKYRLSVGDVLMIRMADPGKIGIIEQDVDAVFASYLVRLSISDGSVVPYYLFYFLGSSEYQGFITGASTGATRKSASAQLMTTPSMLVPPLRLQEAFQETAAETRGLLNVLLKQNCKLREARDLLLPRLLDGRIPV